MPPPMLKSLAKQAGKSLKDAERYYADAKKQRIKAVGKDLTSKDFRYLMGVVKKRLGLPTKPAESVTGMIEAVAAGADSKFLIKLAIGETQVRTFYDAGILRVATMDDILVEPGTDSRVDTVLHLTNELDWPVDHPLSDFEFEGNLSDLYGQVIDLSCGCKTGLGMVYQKRGTTKQRAGARKAQRTKLRRPG